MHMFHGKIALCSKLFPPEQSRIPDRPFACMQNDLVLIEGILYSRNAVDGNETYWMIEIFGISRGD